MILSILKSVSWPFLNISNKRKSRPKNPEHQCNSASNFTVILSFLKRERERTVKVISQTFQAANHLQHERFRPSNVLGRFRPSNVLGRFRPSKVLGRFRPPNVLGRFRPSKVLGRLIPSNVLGRFRPSNILGRFRSSNVLGRFWAFLVLKRSQTVVQTIRNP